MKYTETFIFKIEMRANSNVDTFPLRINMQRVHLHCTFCTDSHINMINLCITFD